MKILSFILFLLINNLICSKMETISMINDFSEKYKIILQGTYFGGCGFSMVTKRQIVEAVKKYLDDNFKEKNLNITVKMKNYKERQIENEQLDYDVEEPNFSVEYFNIFLILNRKRILVGTSDQQNLISYYPHLENSLNQPKLEFLKAISEKIIKITSENIIQ